MNITNREKFLLFQSMELDIHRYLISNTYQIWNGNEKAYRHSIITEKVISFILCEKYSDRVHIKLKKSVHDYLAKILTDRLDEVIGFPINEESPAYDIYVQRFFEVIINHLTEIEEIILKNRKII